MNKYVIGASIGVVLIISAGYFWFRSSSTPSYSTATVQKGSLSQEVSASGNIASANMINLQFQNNGKLTFIGVRVGDKVKAKEVIARQDSSVLNAQLEQSQAMVRVQMAELASLEQGTRPEQIAVTQAQVKSDLTALSQADQSVINAIKSAYTISNDAVHNKIDQFISNSRSTTPSLSFLLANAQISNTVLSERVAIEDILSKWEKHIVNLTDVGTDLSAAEAEARQILPW